MAVAQIVFADAMDANAPVIGCAPRAKEYINATATSQQTTIVAPSPLDRGAQRTVCQITASQGDLWVRFGVNPTASQGNDWLITSGQTRDFGIVPEGWKVAVINA